MNRDEIERLFRQGTEEDLEEAGGDQWVIGLYMPSIHHLNAWAAKRRQKDAAGDPPDASNRTDQPAAESPSSDD